jgi:hypothetical protein
MMCSNLIPYWFDPCSMMKQPNIRKHQGHNTMVSKNFISWLYCTFSCNYRVNIRSKFRALLLNPHQPKSKAHYFTWIISRTGKLLCYISCDRTLANKTRMTI